MHEFKQWGLLLIGFLFSFFAVGIPYWSIPYSEVSLPDTLMAAGMLVVVLASVLLRASGAASVWKTTLIIGASVPAVVLVRVSAETAADPTSHNLWPLEIVIALPMGLAGALAGAIAGILVAKLLAGRTGNGRS